MARRSVERPVIIPFADGERALEGLYLAGEGPEALQYGWRYSNLNVDYFE